MKSRKRLLLLLGLGGGAALAYLGMQVWSQAAADIIVFKSPTCGCCNKWIEHLEENGFRVSAKNKSDMSEIKRVYGIDLELSSCHTGIAGGYVLEGHVPAADIERLLREKPDIVGLSAPGMPIGSPGMEMPGDYKMSYAVLAFDREGNTRVFSQH